MIRRIREILFTSHPHERNVLLFLAWIQGAFVTTTGIASWYLIITSGYPDWARLVLLEIGMPIEIFLSVFVAADYIRHYSMKRILGYSYNPRVAAICEMEGANVPPSTNPHIQALWERHKYDVLHFYVLYDDLADIEALGYEGFKGVREGGTFPALWEGDPGSGKYGGE